MRQEKTWWLGLYEPDERGVCRRTRKVVAHGSVKLRETITTLLAILDKDEESYIVLRKYRQQPEDRTSFPPTAFVPVTDTKLYPENESWRRVD